MSPEVKNVPNPPHRTQERKYSNHISEVSYNSRSITQLPSSETVYHRNSTDSHPAAQGKLGGQQNFNNQSAPVLPKKAPRFSEPANFNSDNWQEGGENETALTSPPPVEQKKLHTLKDSPSKEQIKLSPQPLIMPKTNNFTNSAFRKDK